MKVPVLELLKMLNDLIRKISITHNKIEGKFGRMKNQ